jgi:hypothetical protein
MRAGFYSKHGVRKKGRKMLELAVYHYPAYQQGYNDKQSFSQGFIHGWLLR